MKVWQKTIFTIIYDNKEIIAIEKYMHRKFYSLKETRELAHSVISNFSYYWNGKRTILFLEHAICWPICNPQGIRVFPSAKYADKC